MNTIRLVVDKSGILKKIDHKVEILCYAMLWGAWFLCLAQL
jgi:hypothetical protein